jgi:hypothetical protein
MFAVGSRQFEQIGGPVEKHLPDCFEYEWLQTLVTWSNKDIVCGVFIVLESEPKCKFRK